jgi:hypothetical protein
MGAAPRGALMKAFWAIAFLLVWLGSWGRAAAQVEAVVVHLEESRCVS